MVNRFPRGDPHQHQQWEDFRRGGPMAFDMQARWADPAPAPRAWPRDIDYQQARLTISASYSGGRLG